MTINNPKKFMEGIWDWGFLNDCFCWGIKVTDIDGMVWVMGAGNHGLVERNGEILFIEAKSPGVEVNAAQRQAYAALVARGFTVLWIWGEKNKPKEYVLWRRWEKTHQDYAMGERKPTDENGVKAVVGSWFRWANREG